MLLSWRRIILMGPELFLISFVGGADSAAGLLCRGTSWVSQTVRRYSQSVDGNAPWQVRRRRIDNLSEEVENYILYPLLSSLFADGTKQPASHARSLYPRLWPICRRWAIRECTSPAEPPLVSVMGWMVFCILQSSSYRSKPYFSILVLGMNNTSKTPAVSPAASTPGWDPFGNNSSSNAQQGSLIVNTLVRQFVMWRLCLLRTKRFPTDTQLYSRLWFRSGESGRARL